MKRKYFLDFYDCIIAEINTFDKISSNTLIKHLEKSSLESVLFFKIELKKRNQVKFLINKPIHNLHPNAPKFICETNTDETAIKNIIPAISKIILTIQNDAIINWYSQKDSKIYYASIDYNLNRLPKNELYFLYCYQRLIKENKEIKTLNKQRVFNFKSKDKIEHFIQKQQASIENLANKLIKEINPSNHHNIYEFSNEYNKVDYLKIIFISLEKLSIFIENDYNEYLNVNIKVPYRSILMKENIITPKLEQIKSRLLSEKLNDTLLRIIFEPIIKIATINIQESITYSEFNFCLTYINELFHLLNNEKNEIEDCKIEKWLYEINFNELSFFKYIIDCIISNINKLETEFEKIDFLYSQLKKLNQIQTKNLISYNNKLPSNRQQIISWIEEEIDYLQKKIKLENKNVIIPMHEDKHKMLSGISVAQLSYFFNLLAQSNIIKPDNQREIFKFIADNFKTNVTDSISADSVGAKFYNVETSTKNAIREKIIQLLNLTKS